MNKDSNNGISQEKRSYITIPLRHASIAVAILILMGFLLFLIGYFWGKREAIEQFSIKLTQESFSDHIYTSLCSLYEYGPEQDQENLSNNLTEESGDTDLGVTLEDQGESRLASADNSRESMPISDFVQSESSSGELINPSSDVVPDQRQYYAQLIGFGAEKSAEDFADRLKRRGYNVQVEKRISSSARGKSVAWYQVITERYGDKESLSKIVDRISKEETLKGVRIIAS